MNRIYNLIDSLADTYSSEEYIKAKKIIDEANEQKRIILDYCKNNDIAEIITPNGNSILSPYALYDRLHREVMRDILER